MENLQLRPATLMDLPTLYAFEQGIIEAERPFDLTLKPGHINYYDLKAKVNDADTEVIVATVNEEVVGSAYIDIRPAKPYLDHTRYGYLGFMYVKPAFRRMGINGKIIDKLKQWALARDIHELRLDVYDENSSAVSAYEKAGFSKQMVNMRIRL